MSSSRVGSQSSRSISHRPSPTPSKVAWARAEQERRLALEAEGERDLRRVEESDRRRPQPSSLGGDAECVNDGARRALAIVALQVVRRDVRERVRVCLSISCALRDLRALTCRGDGSLEVAESATRLGERADDPAGDALVSRVAQKLDRTLV